MSLGSTGRKPTTCSTADYDPAVGDLVEFEWVGDSRKATGIIWLNSFKSKFRTNHLNVSLVTGTGGYPVSDMRAIKKIGHTGCMYGVSTWTTANKAAKAYFAQPVFKVGDKVKVVSLSMSAGCLIGDIAEVVLFNSTESVHVKIGAALWALQARNLELVTE